MSDFFKSKMRTYFKRVDFDKDGILTRKDFDAMASRFIERGKLDDAKANDLRTTLTAVWDKYLHPSGGGEQISQDAFVANMASLVGDEANKDANKVVLAGPLPLFFHAVDTNNDGQIQADEYSAFFDILGLDAKLAPDTFKAIDTNNDGDLSMDEFKNAGVDFFFDDNKDNPHSLFWGPLE